MNVAQIGVGGHGLVHLEAITELEQRGLVKLRAVADPFADQLEDVKNRLTAQGTSWYLDYHEMLAAEQDLDAIVICTPIPLHEEMLTATLKASRARILLEKPALPTIQQLDGVIGLEGAERVRIGFQMVCQPQLLAARKLIASGRLGKLRRITVSAGWPRLASYYSRASWAGKMMLGQRPVFDGPATNGLSHLLNNVCFLLSQPGNPLQEPVRVRARLARARRIESYDTFFMEAAFAEVEASFLLSHAVDRHVPFVIRVEGESGSLELLERTPGLRCDLPGFVAPQYDESKGPMYDRFFGDAAAFAAMPCSLADVRAHTLLSNAALVSSGSIATIPDEEIDWPDSDTHPVSIRGLSAVIEQFQGDPSCLDLARFPWAVPGTWVDAKNLRWLDLPNFQ
jgi:predicted dehydrogenase